MSDTSASVPVRIYDVRTAAGSSYILELGTDCYLTRKPGMSRPDGYEEPKRLPGDFTRLPLSGEFTLELGNPAVFIVVLGDDIARFDTAPVITITEVTP